MGNASEPLSSAEGVSDEALLAGTPSPSVTEGQPAEQEQKAPESPPPKVPDKGEPGAGGEEEEPEPDQAAAGEEEEGEAPKEEEPLSEKDVPEDIKPLFKMDGVGPKVRDLYFRDQAYRDVFSTVSEAREVKELLPNGVESAQEMLDVAARLEPFEEVFELAAKDGPGATEFWSRIYEQDQQAYHNLHTRAFENVIHQFHAQAKKAGDENLIAAVDVLWRRVNGEEYKGQEQTQETSLRESSLQEREQKLDEREIQGFKTSTFAETETQVETAISTHVKAVLKDSNVSKGAVGRIVQDIHDEILDKIQQNPTLKIQLNRAFRNGNHGPEHQKAIVSLVVNRAKNLIPEISRATIKEWTGSYLAQNKQQQERQLTSHADVGTGGPPGQPAGALPETKDIDYGKVSDEDLLTGPTIPLKQK